MGQERSGAGGGKEFLRVLDELRTRMAAGDYALNALLPPQRELAKEFGVSRDTLQRALKELVSEGWIRSTQGSGSRVIKVQHIQPVTPRPSMQGRTAMLGPIIAEAFEQPEVSLDVYTLTSESLDAHIRVQAERIRAGQIKPQRITLRMLLPAEELELPYPRSVEAPDDPRVKARLLAITRRHTASLREVLQELRVQRAVPHIDLQIRHAPLMPTFKLYMLNGSAALHGLYIVTERRIVLEGGEEIDALDVLGVGATLMHYVADSDPTSTESVYVATMQSWFDSVWNLLAT
ncbi:GntR family transcriptional regulator [Streptomyces apricus]|uniref:GntR family transcriptional regulator n=1 Tax=Streptomyces apricus TaxID=1828112 RepID=A0A5B0BL53_9ACTN|nr:GntR family transcriptional regulator [Streptomyces apricus]KAA0942954.1 GntR family transcriptional regulator [Streptomyces apricus]